MAINQANRLWSRWAGRGGARLAGEEEEDVRVRVSGK